MDQQNASKVRWSVRLDRELADRFAALAEREHRSVEGQLRFMIEKAVEARPEPPAEELPF